MNLNTSAATTSPDTETQLIRQMQLGEQHYSKGQIDQAIFAYQCGLDAGTASSIEIASDLLADLHAKLGVAYLADRRFGAATEAYKSALRLKPTLIGCWCNLGNAQLEIGNVSSAIEIYLEALKLNPAHWASRVNLAEALMRAKQYLMAKTLLLECVRERPQDGKLRHQLGKACFELNEDKEALQHFQAALTIDPGDSESLYWIGGIRQRMDDIDGAQAAYAQAATIHPLIQRKASSSSADFRLLALYAPLAGNVPVEYLFKNATYDIDILPLIEGHEVDVTAFEGVQLVVNLVSDADQADAILSLATNLVERLNKPVINHPKEIRHTTRDAIARLLTGIPNCCVPKILRLKAGTENSADALAALLPFSWPVLARPAGTHGGDDFEKIASLPELTDFMAKHSDSDNYLIEYIDYVSTDGFFRKYRFIFVGDDILPYHLAIGDNWKVHHDSTDMSDHSWMQQEEADFLASPETTFSADNYRVLRTIRQRVGLDYFGIDCGLDRDGNVVVFEVNASMLVHADNAGFSYKNPFVETIKLGFDTMLRQRALG